MKALKSKQVIAFVCFNVDYLRAKLTKFLSENERNVGLLSHRHFQNSVLVKIPWKCCSEIGRQADTTFNVRKSEVSRNDLIFLIFN